MRLFKVYFLPVALILSFSSSTHAGSTPLTKIEKILVHEGDRVFIKTVDYLNPPDCAKEIKEFAIDVSTNTGKAMYSAALAAASQGKQVEIHGKHGCNYWGDREDINVIVVPF
ncbi:hypothetical protein [Microbulbifer sp. DLAB2-AA]|uniref:hypothetical protein n=1 Tax=Microbulbifer sp. DLAB2-AA TaxID=3243394 RepID=UPI004039008E